MIERTMRLLAILLGAFAALAACGARSTIPMAGDASSASLAANANARLTATVAIARPFSNAEMLRLYAYPLSARGPLGSPPPSSLVAMVNVATGSPKCTISGATRTCAIRAQVPSGNDALVAVLARGTRVLARGLAAVDASSATTIALAAGGATISRLGVVAPAILTGQRFYAGVVAYSESGAVVLTSPSTPITLHVYAPPKAIPQPENTAGVNGATAAFAYSGTSVTNAMTVTAILGTMSNTAAIYPSGGRRAACAPLGASRVYKVPEPLIYANGFSLHAAVAGSSPISVALDTGSVSFLIAKKKLTNADASQLIGPGQAAQETLEPSGITVKGHYYLAPVTLYDRGGSHKLGTTVPMEVLVAETSCSKTGICKPSESTYLGIGFGRPSPGPTASAPVMDSPRENAFMQLSPIVQGTMHPGFILTPTQLTIGINASVTKGFNFFALDPMTGVSGDWFGPRACLRSNGAGAYQCGKMLLDIGINTMYVRAMNPTPVTEIEIVAPGPSRPYLSYSFPYPVAANATPPAPNPNALQPVQFLSPSPSPFVNTGRDALAAASYAYDAGCGRVGFR